MHLPLKASDFERRRLDNHMAKYSVHINIACCMFYVVANMHIIYIYCVLYLHMCNYLYLGRPALVGRVGTISRVMMALHVQLQITHLLTAIPNTKYNLVIILNTKYTILGTHVCRS